MSGFSFRYQHIVKQKVEKNIRFNIMLTFRRTPMDFVTSKFMRDQSCSKSRDEIIIIIGNSFGIGDQNCEKDEAVSDKTLF